LSNPLLETVTGFLFFSSLCFHNGHSAEGKEPMTDKIKTEHKPPGPDQVAEMIVLLADFYVTLGMEPTRAYRAAMHDLRPEVEETALSV
jgi:hypothetical protein